MKHRYIEEIYKIIARRRPNLSRLEIDARAEATIMCWLKSIDEIAYRRIYNLKPL